MMRIADDGVAENGVVGSGVSDNGASDNSGNCTVADAMEITTNEGFKATLAE